MLLFCIYGIERVSNIPYIWKIGNIGFWGQKGTVLGSKTRLIVLFQIFQIFDYDAIVRKFGIHTEKRALNFVKIQKLEYSAFRRALLNSDHIIRLLLLLNL